MQQAPVVSVVGLSKSFGGTQALVDVSLDFQPGEIHALVGENGAGKSTLIRVLGGTHSPDSGQVLINSQAMHLGDVVASEKAGISVVHQESTAFLDLSVEDNLFVGREPRFMKLLIDKSQVRLKTNQLLNRIGAKVPLGVPLHTVSLAQRQLVAIARALSFDSKLLILDEPTASLSTKEADTLHGIVRSLRDAGTAVLYVSHRLEDVLDLADRVTVLRDGRLVSTWGANELTRELLIQAMIGRDLEPKHAEQIESETPRPVKFEARNLYKTDAFENISFQVHEGEILGLGGLVGAGRTEVARAAFGIDTPDSGETLVSGKPLKSGNVRTAVEAGLALVPEDRQHEGLILEQSVADNIVMALRGTHYSRGLLKTKEESSIVEGGVKDFSIKVGNTQNPVASLSGGNQQKVVFSKWLATKPEVLILDEPTRGVDVGSKAEIHEEIRQLASKGAAVVVISSDLPELLALSHRIVVLRAGRIAGELKGHDMNEVEVLKLAFGEDRT